MRIQSHKDLIVWQKSIQLVSDIYSLTGSFPNDERYGLTAQMRRAAVSIPSNIAEGRRRSTRKDFRQFALNAFASGAELETQIEIAKNLGFTKAEYTQNIEKTLDEIMRMLNVITMKLNQPKATSNQLQPTSS